MELDFLTKKELDQLELKYRSRRKNLIVLCLVFTAAFVLVVTYLEGLATYNVIQGLYLAVVFVFVSFISETEKKIRKIRSMRKSV